MTNIQSCNVTNTLALNLCTLRFSTPPPPPAPPFHQHQTSFVRRVSFFVFADSSRFIPAWSFLSFRTLGAPPPPPKSRNHRGSTHDSATNKNLITTTKSTCFLSRFFGKRRRSHHLYSRRKTKMPKGNKAVGFLFL